VHAEPPFGREVEDCLILFLDDEKPSPTVGAVRSAAVGVKTAPHAHAGGTQDADPGRREMLDENIAAAVLGTTLEPAGGVPLRPGRLGESPLSGEERGDFPGVHGVRNGLRSCGPTSGGLAPEARGHHAPQAGPGSSRVPSGETRGSILWERVEAANGASVDTLPEG
jgi:hypothetical protein